MLILISSVLCGDATITTIDSLSQVQAFTGRVMFFDVDETLIIPIDIGFIESLPKSDAFLSYASTIYNSSVYDTLYRRMGDDYYASDVDIVETITPSVVQSFKNANWVMAMSSRNLNNEYEAPVEMLKHLSRYNISFDDFSPKIPPPSSLVMRNGVIFAAGGDKGKTANSLISWITTTLCTSSDLKYKEQQLCKYAWYKSPVLVDNLYSNCVDFTSALSSSSSCYHYTASFKREDEHKMLYQLARYLN